MVSIRTMVFSLSCLVLQGCKLIQEIPEGGKVVSESGLYDCGENQVCEISNDGTEFSVAFTAVPNEGWRFVSWQESVSDSYPSACGGSTDNTCEFTAPPSLTVMDIDVFLAPIFEPLIVNTDSELEVSFTQTPKARNSDGYAKFGFIADNAETFQCRYGGDQWALCASPVFLEWVEEGEHRFEVKAVAEDGTEGAIATFHWTAESLLDVGSSELIATNQSPELVAQNSWRGIFRINCDFSHSSYNDPIVYPGQENAAHLHRFYGNMLVDHETTLESLYTTGDATCQGNTLNRSGYWVPALLSPLYDPISGERQLDSNGDPAWQTVPAVVGNDDEAHEIFYYSAGVDDLDSIQVVPPGLRIIAGEHHTMPGQEQDSSIVRWHCQSWGSDDSSNPRFSASIPECVAPDRVRMDIFFPSCWNGTDLDSEDHKSHMAYPVNDGGPQGTRCPDSHPVPVVRPSYHYAFGVKPEVYDPETQSSRGWRLASDMYDVSTNSAGGLSLHGDWFNGWHPQVMQLILDNCIKGQLDCHDGNLAMGYRLSGTQAGSQIEAEIVNMGLGYD